jgi:hypothetical protein
VWKDGEGHTGLPSGEIDSQGRQPIIPALTAPKGAGSVPASRRGYCFRGSSAGFT